MKLISVQISPPHSFIESVRFIIDGQVGQTTAYRVTRKVPMGAV